MLPEFMTVFRDYTADSRCRQVGVRVVRREFGLIVLLALGGCQSQTSTQIAASPTVGITAAMPADPPLSERSSDPSHRPQPTTPEAHAARPAPSREEVSLPQLDSMDRKLTGRELWREVLSQYLDTLRQRPQWTDYVTRLAWLLATHDDPRVRDADASLRLADLAIRVSSDPTPRLLETRAAAHAAGGNMAAAVANARQAVEASRFAADSVLQERRERLQSYRAGAVVWNPVSRAFDPDDHPDRSKTAARLAYVHGLLAETLQGDSEIAQSLVAYRTALRFDPTYRFAMRGIGAALMRLGRFDEAAEVLSGARAIYPHDPRIQGYLGMVELRRDRVPEADQLLRSAIAAIPDWHEATQQLAWICAAAGDPRFRDSEQAVDLAERLCRATGYGNPAYLDTLAVANSAAGNFPEAIRRTRQALEQLEGSQGALAQRLRTRLAQYEAREPVRVELAQAGERLIRRRNMVEAEQFFAARVDSDPHDAAALANLGLLRLAQQRVSEAMELWDESLSLGPLPPRVAGRLAHVMLMHSDPSVYDPQRSAQLSEAACVATEYKVPRYIDTHAAALAELGRFDDAILMKRRAIDRSIESGCTAKRAIRASQLAEFEAGRALEKSYRFGDPQPALRRLSELEKGTIDAETLEAWHVKRLGLNSDWTHVVDELAWVLATSDDRHLRDAARAQRLAEHVCQRTKYQEARFLDTLAAAYAHVGHFRDAVDVARRALRLRPLHSGRAASENIRDRLELYRAGRRPWKVYLTGPIAEDLPETIEPAEALAYVHQLVATRLEAHGRARQATVVYELCLKLNPRNRPAHVALGRRYRHEGRFVEAERHLMIALWLESYDVDALVELGVTRFDLGQPEQTVALLSEALRLRPSWDVATNNLAWLLATFDDPEIRRPHKALEIIEPLCESQRADDPQYLDTLAAAYAGVGDFPAAVDTARRAAALADAREDLSRAASVRARLQRYEKGLDYRWSPTRSAQAITAAPSPSTTTSEGAKDRSAERADVDALADQAAESSRQGDVKQAVALWERVVKLRPAWHAIADRMAWVLATHSDPQLRNASRAQELAEMVCHATEYESPEYLDTLAAARAAAGRHEEALQLAEQAFRLALAVGRDPLARRIEKRRDEYRAGRTPQFNTDGH